MRPKIGLALSGGGARGAAHIGVLKVFEEASIPIDCIGGTSMGGIIAAAYACGWPISAIEEKTLRLANMREMVRLIDLSPQRRGLLEGNHVRDFLADFFLDQCFNNLKIPLALPSVDLITAREIVFTDGLVFPAVLATMAVPGLFKPVEIGPYRLIDGGVLNNLPIDRVRALGADVVIAVDVQFAVNEVRPWQDLPESQRIPLPLPSFFLDFYRAQLIMIAEITTNRMRTCPPDYLVSPSIPPDIDIFLGFPRIAEVIAAGEEAARAAIPEIKRLL
jgi:NTE family protein